MIFSLIKQVFTKAAKLAYMLGNRLTGGILGIVITTLKRFFQARAPEVAAGMAYYFIFSLFPLLIFLIALGSYVLETDQARAEVFAWLVELFPTATDLIDRNLQLVVTQRGPAGITALVGLLWAGSGAFNALARNINRAWPNAKPRGFFRGRLVALGMVLVLAILFFLAIFSNTVANVLSAFDIPLLNGQTLSQTFLWELAADWVSIFFTFVMFITLYRWIPTAYVSWPEAGGGALLAAFCWHWATGAFTWYLSSGWASYQLIYGTLATMIALMFWIYVGNLITLLGAHLSASIALHRRLDLEFPSKTETGRY